MLLRMFYSPKKIFITAIVAENLYWKAVDICKIAHFKSHIGDVLHRYIPGETILRLSDVIPSTKNSKMWVVSTGQVLKFMANIPDFRRDYIFDKWFLNVFDGTQKFYPENHSNFMKCLIQVPPYKLCSVDVKPVMEDVNYIRQPYEFTIPILFQERVKIKNGDDKTKQSLNKSEPSSQQENKQQQSMESVKVVQFNLNPETIITEQSPSSHNCVSSSVCDNAVLSSINKSLIIDEDKSFDYRDPIYGGQYKYYAIQLNWNENHLTPISIYPYIDKHAEKFYLYAPVKNPSVNNNNNNNNEKEE